MHSSHYIKTRHRLAAVVATILMLLSSGNISAQVMDTRRQVDTLSLADRISVRTNMVDWTLLVPNVGIELDLGKTNWSRYAVNLNLRYRPSTNETYAKPVTLAVTEVRLEARHYWRERQAELYGPLRRHSRWYDKLMSCRRMVPRHPKTTYYRGVFVAFNDFSIRIPNVFTYGKKGQLLMAGITWGFVRPLYAFPNGNSLDLDLGISGGVGMTQWDSYRYLSTHGTNETLWHKTWDLVHKPIITDLRVGFVYRFGKYPIQKKYRWRYDVDLAYRALKDGSYFKVDSIAWQKHQNDSLYKVADAEFRALYDSIVAVHAVETQEKIDTRAAEYKEKLQSEGAPVKEKNRAQRLRSKSRRKE